MKKSFIFASFIAVVAMLAASCTPKVEAPKARFTYAADGLTVTFTNASKDADTYAWDFGDGAVSDLKDPVHEYAQAGSYTVKLTAKNAGGENSMTETIELVAKAWSIKIDGNFDDWAEVPADALAESVVSEDASLEELYKIRFATDADYIYFYAEFNADPEMVLPMSIVMNTDDDANTGMASWLWVDAGIDILIEHGDVNSYSDAGIYSFAGASPDDWAWDPVEASGAFNTSEVKVIKTGVAAFEGSIMRASIPNLKALKVGVWTSDGAWTTESGALPATVIDDEGMSVVPPMLEVKLN